MTFAVTALAGTVGVPDTRLVSLGTGTPIYRVTVQWLLDMRYPPICTLGRGVVLVATGAPNRLFCAAFLGR